MAANNTAGTFTRAKKLKPRATVSFGSISSEFLQQGNFIPGKKKNVITAIANKNDPAVINGSVKPPTSYKIPPSVGPIIRPTPAQVSNAAKTEKDME